MGYPQQPQNDPNQYPQQPYQQQPGYPQAPTSGTPNFSNINFASVTTMENRPYLIAGVGGLIAFLSYFILPYVGYSYHFAVTGISNSSGSGSYTGSWFGSWLLFSMLGGLVALVVAALMALRIQAVPQLTPQLGSRILIGSGALSAIALLIFLVQYNNDINSAGLSGLNELGDSFSVGLSFGFFIAVLATIAIIVGGVMAFRKTA